MTADMRIAIYHQMDFGQLALQKLGQTDPNFRLYMAGMKPERPKEWTHMEVVGAIFREPKSGANIGKLSIMVPGTRRSVNLTRAELAAFREKNSSHQDATGSSYERACRVGSRMDQHKVNGYRFAVSACHRSFADRWSAGLAFGLPRCHRRDVWR